MEVTLSVTRNVSMQLETNEKYSEKKPGTTSGAKIQGGPMVDLGSFQILKEKLELPIKLASTSKLLFNSPLSEFRVVEDLILENVPCKSQKTLFPASSASPVSMTG